MTNVDSQFDGAHSLPPYLNDAQLAAFLGIHPATPRQWRYQKRGPVYVKLAGGAVRYARTALLAWLRAQIVDPASRKDGAQ